MPINIYNTLNRQKEEFIPLNPPQVGMYVCGITPYDETHVGHARAYVTFDIVRRYLEYSGYKVHYIQNITDIDDKIIQKAQALGRDWKMVADEYAKSYFDMMARLNVKPATQYPKATEHIPDMINTIRILIEKGYAYAVSGDVYFEVQKFKDYGRLSRRKLDEMESGARVAIDKRKRNAGDFALWKSAKAGEPSWESPWGQGRPGWHIECSAMSTKYLGDTFDIHGGGMDLIFPHHENEIAQAECATGKPFAKYFMHNGFITVNKEKMSKSLGNFFALKDILAKYEPMAVRLFLLSTHYRSPIDFTDEQLTSSQTALESIKNSLFDYDFILKRQAPNADFSQAMQDMALRFEAEMEDDFNTAGALSIIFEMVKFSNQNIKHGQIDANVPEKIKTLLKVLGIEIRKKDDKIDDDIKKLIKEREAARKNKDFTAADRIRKELEKKGVKLEDTVFGTKWSKHA